MNTEMPAEFAVHAEQRGSAYVVAPIGELDLGTVDELRELIAARPRECERLVIDLSGLSFFDTSGMRLVIETMHEARTRGILLALVRGSEDVQRLFSMAQIEDRLPFFDDRRAALGHR
jgi:anti-sigma B factor antagonist